LAEDKEIAYWAAWSTVLEGWAVADQGMVDEGVAKMQDGLAAYRSTGAELFRPYSLALLVQVLAAAGRETEALDCLEQALASVRETDSRFAEAELYRLRGEIRLQLDSENAAGVEDLETAIVIAERQGATMLELRATLALADGVVGSRRDEALIRLARALGRVTGGKGNRDVARAQDALASAHLDRTACG
jgi:predicted ATPase